MKARIRVITWAVTVSILAVSSLAAGGNHNESYDLVPPILVDAGHPVVMTDPRGHTVTVSIDTNGVHPIAWQDDDDRWRLWPVSLIKSRADVRPAALLAPASGFFILLRERCGEVGDFVPSTWTASELVLYADSCGFELSVFKLLTGRGKKFLGRVWSRGRVPATVVESLKTNTLSQLRGFRTQPPRPGIHRPGMEVLVLDPAGAGLWFHVPTGASDDTVVEQVAEDLFEALLPCAAEPQDEAGHRAAVLEPHSWR